MSTSLKNWFNELPWMMQGVLMSAIRNCDGKHNDNTPQKTLTRGVRAACIKAAVTTGSFNARRPDFAKIAEAAELFTDSYMDEMPLHYVTHLMAAAEIIGCCHPSAKVRIAWGGVYLKIVRAMHLNPETERDLRDRLADDPEQVARETSYDKVAFASGVYGDGTGTINEVVEIKEKVK